MTQKKTEKFHIDYTLDPKTQNVKLTFSQGGQKCVINWYDKEENSWEEVVNFCSRLEDVLEECGSENFHINYPVHRIIIVVGGFEFYPGYVFILDPNTEITSIEGMEWVQRQKLYGKFKVEPLALIKGLYSVISGLAKDPQYVGMDKSIKEKVESLARDIAEKENKRNRK